MTEAVFVDTSAVLAFLVATDRSHRDAVAVVDELARGTAPLVTSSYVLVETYALLGRRFGSGSVRRFREELVPLFEVVWVDAALHEKGLDLLLSRGRRRLSLVDAVSFVIVRERGIERAFAYDDDFEKEGIATLG